MNTKYLVLFLSAVFFAVSCDKVVEKEAPAPQEKSTEVIIHASLVGNGDTKTVLQENGAVYWQPGDQIAVFFNSIKVPFTSFNNVDAASAYFVGNMDITTAHNENSDGTLAGEYVFWGLYPLYSLPDYYGRGFYYRYNRISYCDNVYDDMYTEDYYGRISYLLSAGDCNGKIVSTVSHYWQKAVAGTFDAPLNIALAKSDDYHELSFYNVLGGVRFSVQSPDITRVTFKGNNQEVLAGEFSVKMDTDGKPVITEVSDPFEMVTLTLEDGGTFTPGEWYYIMLFPTVLSKGYTVELYKDNIKAKKVVTSSVEVKRSVFGSLANVDADLVFDTEVVFCDEINIEGERYVSIGGETQFIAHPQPENCTFPRVWRSENPSIATVDENGIVKGVSQGETYINFFVDYEYEGKWIRVLGENECGSLTIQTPDGNDIDYYVAQHIGEQIQLTAVPSPSSFTGTIVWSSDDENVATVDQTGLVTITGDGYCNVTAQAGDVTNQVSINATRIDYSGISVSITTSDGNDIDYVNAQYSGEQIQLTASLSPSTVIGTIVWSSDNENVATVDQTGLVTITGEGACHITAQVGSRVSDQVLIYAWDLNPSGRLISIDGNFDDWDALPSGSYSSCYGYNEAPHQALTHCKVYANSGYVYVYIEWNTNMISYETDVEHVPFHCYINTDGLTTTGGFANEFSDACNDVCLEGFLYPNGVMGSYNPIVLSWAGTVNGSGWEWEDLGNEGIFCHGAGVDGKYEILISRSAIAALGFPIANEFSIGFDIQQDWNAVGILPNAVPSDNNPNGLAPSLSVTTQQ